MLAVGALLALGRRPTWLELQQEFRQAEHPALLPKLVTPGKLGHDVAGFQQSLQWGPPCLAGGTAVRILSTACSMQGPFPYAGRDVFPGMPRPLPLMICILMIQRTQLCPLQMRCGDVQPHSLDLKLPGTCMQASHLYNLQENREGSSQVQVRRRTSKPSQEVPENQMVNATKAANKKQQAAKQQAAKAAKTAKKAETNAKAEQAFTVSCTLLMCTHQSDALQTTMVCMAPFQVTMPVRSGIGATGVLGAAATEIVTAENGGPHVQHHEPVQYERECMQTVMQASFQSYEPFSLLPELACRGCDAGCRGLTGVILSRPRNPANPGS